MRRFIWLALALVGLGLVAAGSVAAASVGGGGLPLTGAGSVPLGATPTWTPPTCGWSFVASPNRGTSGNILHTAAALSANDIWAIGQYVDDTSFKTQTLIQHWDGAAWTLVPSPNLGSSYSYLHGVAALAPDDVWAVGYYGDGIIPEPMTMHWDGNAWTLVPAPYPPADASYLYGVDTVSANDVWAVGYYRVGQTFQTLIEHWNGAAWSIVPSPNRGSSSTLLGIAVAAANDVWAVGDSTNNPNLQTLIEHWNGSTWTIVPSPNRSTSSHLDSVAVITPDDIWAAGYYYDFPTDALLTFTAHWDGSTWSFVPSPTLGTDSLFNGVAAAGTNDVWAVGDYSTGSTDQTLVEHWDGSHWSIVPSPNQGADPNSFAAVVALAPDDAWAFGDYLPFAGNRTLIEHYGGPCPAPTPTPCPVQFSDVAPSDPFYPYIRCLACRGVLSGYTTSPPCAPGGAPCFAAGASVTRGQIAKIVSNAAGYNEVIPSPDQIFEDVPYNNPFWVYVERLAGLGRDYLSGYACGQAPAGPCVAPANRPYFLPGNPVTRGQTAKLVSEVANYQEVIPSSRQTFSDVPPGNPFWVYTERAALHGVLSGYTTNPPCTTGVPCFLVSNPVTRGQTAKLVANAFYPACQTPAR